MRPKLKKWFVPLGGMKNHKLSPMHLLLMKSKRVSQMVANLGSSDPLIHQGLWPKNELHSRGIFKFKMCFPKETMSEMEAKCPHTSSYKKFIWPHTCEFQIILNNYHKSNNYRFKMSKLNSTSFWILNISPHLLRGGKEVDWIFNDDPKGLWRIKSWFFTWFPVLWVCYSLWR